MFIAAWASVLSTTNLGSPESIKIIQDRIPGVNYLRDINFTRALANEINVDASFG